MIRTLVAVILCFFGLQLKGEESRIWIDAAINGQKVRLALDTGASHSVLFRKTVDRLKIKTTDAPTHEPSPGKVAGPLTEPVDFEYGKIKEGMDFLVLPDPPSTFVETELEGLLSWYPFRDNVIILEGKARRAEITDTLPPWAARAQKFKQLDEDLLSFQAADQNSQNRNVYIDTGADDAFALHPSLWEKWVMQHPDQPATMVSLYSVSAGLMVMETRWADIITIGSLTVTDVPIREVHKQEVLTYKPGYAATLGIGALERLDLAIDGKNKLVYARQRPELPSEHPHNRLGTIFAPTDHQSDPLVAHVATNSPGYRAGIRHGDVLLKIGELDVTKWRTDPAVMPIGRFWSDKPGTKHNLTLKRGDGEYQVSVVLQDILAPNALNATKTPKE